MTIAKMALKPLVLVVEDDPMTRMLSVCLAEDAGFETLSACNADEAIISLQNNPQIQIVFTDVEMPGSMCGKELATLVKQRWPWIGILVTSGRADPRKIGFHADTIFVAKPYGVQEIVTSLHRLSASCQAKFGDMQTSPTAH